MARLEARWEQGGMQYAVQFVRDMTPKRVRAYLCSQTGEVVIRPRVTSAHSDTLIVRGVPGTNELSQAWAMLEQAGMQRQHIYPIEKLEWSEDRGQMAQTPVPPPFRPPGY
jgi:hypothetical protein